MSARLFVYGTLTPGHDAWPRLEPWVVGVTRTDAVAGAMYDTGRGYPAATFTPDAAVGGGVVHGTIVTLDPDRAEAALAALDHYEGPEYRRITVQTLGGVETAVYAWIAPLEACRPVPEGRWYAEQSVARQAETPGPDGR